MMTISNETRWVGGCLCGSVRYEALGEGTNLCFCHCTSCRRATGVPAVPWVTFERARFRVTQGELTEYRSSPHVLRGFCARCGTSLTYCHDERDAEIDVTIASLDDPSALAPASHIWLRDKLAWERPLDELPQYATVSDEADAAQPVFSPPAGYHSVTARIVTQDAAGLVAFVREVFGASGEYHQDRPTDARIGDSGILISDAGARPPIPAFLYVYVADVDGTYRRALSAGARSIEEPRKVEYGDYRAMIEDHWGNTWQIATRAAAP